MRSNADNSSPNGYLKSVVMVCCMHVWTSSLCCIVYLDDISRCFTLFGNIGALAKHDMFYMSQQFGYEVCIVYCMLDKIEMQCARVVISVCNVNVILLVCRVKWCFAIFDHFRQVISICNICSCLVINVYIHLKDTGFMLNFRWVSPKRSG